MQTIQCKYSCHLCGLKGVTVEVPARGEEEVSIWMRQVLAEAIGLDHFRKSPRCKATTIDEIMIPIAGADRVGGPAVQ